MTIPISTRISTLPNGMRIVTDTVPTVETVSMGVWVDVGTRNESADLSGVSHLLEHMAFKGTQRRSAIAIAEEIEAVGGHLNAYTGRENTAFYARVLREDLPLAFDILADITQHAVLDPEELARERVVVLQEIGQAHDTPDDIVFDHFQAAAFPEQALGRPVLGDASIVRELSRDRLRAYMHAYYGAPSMVIAAAGNVEHAHLVDLAATAFCDLPHQVRTDQEAASYAGGDFREERDLEQLHLLLGFAGIGYHDADFYAMSVLSTLLGGGMSSRLFQEVREKRGLAYAIHSFTSHYRDTGLFGVYAATGGDLVGELVPVMCDELAKAAIKVCDAEVDRARNQLKASLLMALESTMSRCEQAGQQMLVYGRTLPTEEVLGALAAVDAAAVRRVAARMLQSRLTLAALGPVGELESYDAVARRLA